MTNNELVDLAIRSMKNSYSPYSGCTVGAALLTKSGKVFTGCNIENASFSATVCAERTAVFKAVSEGEREFSAIAVAGGKEGKVQGFMPCGVCRQVLSEFGAKDMKILVAKEDGNFNTFTLNELLPKAFEGDFI